MKFKAISWKPKKQEQKTTPHPLVPYINNTSNPCAFDGLIAITQLDYTVNFRDTGYVLAGTITKVSACFRLRNVISNANIAQKSLIKRLEKLNVELSSDIEKWKDRLLEAFKFYLIKNISFDYSETSQTLSMAVSLHNGYKFEILTYVNDTDEILVFTIYKDKRFVYSGEDTLSDFPQHVSEFLGNHINLLDEKSYTTAYLPTTSKTEERFQSAYGDFQNAIGYASDMRQAKSIAY